MTTRSLCCRICWLAQALLVVAFAMQPAVAQSLYQEGSYRALTADNKAFRVGDAITVQVVENASATASADTATRRKNGLSADLSHGNGSVGQVAASAGGDFDGGGRTQRANRLLATLTVTVREVLPNNELRIAGEQMVTINDEPQRVSLEGRVRAIDISDANVVASSRVADARITYVGEGDIAQRSQRSWWRRLIDAVGF